MNLILDRWLPVIRKNGEAEKIAMAEILSNYEDNPVVEISAPRPDLRSAIYQLLVGVVQVSAGPSCEAVWEERFHKPYCFDIFSNLLNKYADCFELTGTPAFMQDFSLEESGEKKISSILIDSPGDRTIQNNMDHFVKSGMVQKIDAYWAAAALYTLQTFAPSGGQGHRTSLRGGGPLTTMLTIGISPTLWENIWINVVSNETAEKIPGNMALTEKSAIFPWMKPTKQSSLSDSGLYCSEVHPYHHFFGMPRRIRLDFSMESGTCDLTGEYSQCLVKTFRTKNYGNNYSGVWNHPLNAYAHDPKTPDKEPLSIKAQPGGIGYSHWAGLAIETDNVVPALVVRQARMSKERRKAAAERQVGIWASGYDMDNMKARCWYESKMPIFGIGAEEAEETTKVIGCYVKTAQEIAQNLRYAIKSSWANRPADLSGDMSYVDSSFWQETESAFYKIVPRFIENIADAEVRDALNTEWAWTLKKAAEQLFEQYVLDQQENGLNMPRIIKAKLGLGKGIGKMFNNLKALNEVKE